MATIQFNNNDTAHSIKGKSQLKKFLLNIFKEENVEVSHISYVFCNDKYLHRLNQTYLEHDTLTDILTFTLSDVGSPIVSDIFISVERVKENAEKLKVSYSEELLRVIIHGILHLCGYNDHSKMEKTFMRTKEDFYLAAYPYRST